MGLLSVSSPPSPLMVLLLMEMTGGGADDSNELEKIPPELQKDLTDFADAINLSLRELAHYYHMIAIHKFIMECHTIPITQNQKTNGSIPDCQTADKWSRQKEQTWRT